MEPGSFRLVALHPHLAGVGPRIGGHHLPHSIDLHEFCDACPGMRYFGGNFIIVVSSGRKKNKFYCSNQCKSLLQHLSKHSLHIKYNPCCFNVGPQNIAFGIQMAWHERGLGHFWCCRGSRLKTWVKKWCSSDWWENVFVSVYACVSHNAATTFQVPGIPSRKKKFYCHWVTGAHSIDGCLEGQVASLDFFGLNVIQGVIASWKTCYLSLALFNAALFPVTVYQVNPETTLS